MPQKTFDVTATTTDQGLQVNATTGDQVIQSFLLPDEIVTANDLAAWLLAQRGRPRSTDTQLQKRLIINYHTEQTIDPETGATVDQTIIDNVQSDPLPADDGRSNFTNLPGWATWTANEAQSWVEDNVTDLASAKTALKAMATAIIFFRNIVVD